MDDAIRAENQEFASGVRSPEAKEVMRAFLEEHPSSFSRTKETIKAEKVS